MSTDYRVSVFSISYWVGAVFVLLLTAISCTVPKKYQKFKPFVYKTNINLNSNLPVGEKQQLRTSLNNQLDDSIRVRTVLAVGWPPMYYRLLRPPVFDSINVGRSKTFMTALLNSQGYFKPVITDTFTVDTLRDQYRVNISFDVTPGIALRIDSIAFDLETPELQQLAIDSRGQSLLKKNTPYSVPVVSAELDRLLTIYRNNGYYKISKEDLYAQVDTVAFGLLDPTLDPFEQVRLLQELQEKSLNPTIDVVIKQRIDNDSSNLQKFYVGNVAVYPELSILLDTAAPHKYTSTVGEYKFFYNTRRFKLPFIARNISLKKGSLYKQSDYYETINTFNNLGAWQQVGIDLSERYDSLPLLDAVVRLYPAKKYGTSIDFETSRNTGDVITIGQLFGIGLNFGLRNRNAFRESIQTSTNLRFGVELGTRLVQTLQTTLAHSIYIPKFIPNVRWGNKFILPRTIVNLNASYTDRREFFRVRSANASWGYDFAIRNTASKYINHTWQWIPFNVEYTQVHKLDSFIKLQGRIPSLQFAFNDGLIMSQILAYSTGRTKERPKSIRNTLIRIRGESSGAILGMIKTLEQGALRRYIKGDVEYKYLITHKRSGWAFRLFGGYGYIYGMTGNTPENNLPFFKAFYAGGPYSMRAWQIRQLGPGSSSIYDRPGEKSIDRFGDMQMEGNAEFRFNLATIFGIKVKSALFVDAGNVWSKLDTTTPLTPPPDPPIPPNFVKEAQFKIGRLYEDLAVAGGTGVRFDFDFFLIRLDYAFKLKNPLYAKQNGGWFQNIQPLNGQFQLGIGYPF